MNIFLQLNEFQDKITKIFKKFFIFLFLSTYVLGKGPACNAGDPGSTPGLGRSAEEGIDYPLQYSWTSLVAQLVKNPPAVRETWV